MYDVWAVWRLYDVWDVWGCMGMYGLYGLYGYTLAWYNAWTLYGRPYTAYMRFSVQLHSTAYSARRVGGPRSSMLEWQQHQGSAAGVRTRRHRHVL